MVITGGFTIAVLELLAEWLAILAVFLPFVRLRLRPRIERDLRAVAEARSLLGEVGD